MISILLVLTVGIIILVWLVRKIQHQLTVKNLLQSKLRPEWIEILQHNLAVYSKLPDELKHKLQGLINLFLYDKVFSGYGGLEITDEIRVTIAAQACMLMLNRDEALYPYLKNIYVYPGAFWSDQTISDGLVSSTKKVIRIGESWHLGHVVLSWKDSRQGATNEHDGHNVVYHEFAHQLDHADGVIDGTPVLDEAGNYKEWSRVFSDEFNRLRVRVARHKRSDIDPYGAVSEGEFFAVVTEIFFEKPEVISKGHPGLYTVLVKYYHLNPLEWF